MTDIATLVADNIHIWTGAIQRKSSAGRGGGKRISLYGIERLRALILDLAVRGKLVPQDAADEPACELLKRVKAERAKRIKAKSIRKGKAFATVSQTPPFEIPSNWIWTQLSEIGHDWGQKKPSSSFTYIDVGSIDQTSGVVQSPSLVEANDAPSRARKVVRKGTVIYSTVRPYLLNIAIVDRDFDPEPIASTAFAIIHPFEGIEAGFVSRYLRSAPFVSYVESCQTGIAYPAINDRQFFSAWCPLPPVREQRRIVAKVDELMALCDALERESADAMAAHQALVEMLLATLVNSADAADLARQWARLESHFDNLFTTDASIDALKQTILDLAVRGKLVEQESPSLTKWIESPLEKLIGPMDSGWSPACHEFPSTSDDVWGVLKTTAVQDMRYDANQNKELPAKFEPRPNAEARVGDVLITRAGPTNRVGICCFVASTRPRLMISDKIIRFRPISSVIEGAFLALALSVGTAAQQIEKAKSGMAASQVNISQSKLKAIIVPVPPLAEQRHIVAKVDALIALCDALKARLADAAQTQRDLADAITERAAA